MSSPIHKKPQPTSNSSNDALKYLLNQPKAVNNDDQNIDLINQTNTIFDVNQTTKNIIIQDLYSSTEIIQHKQYENKNMMEKLVQQNSNVSQIPRDSSETSEVIVLTTSVRLNDLLSYQDVMDAIQREFHLHAGQEREIIMKLWLKGQTMISILQRFRHLLEDLSIDDKDFVAGLKQIREMINYADRDVHNLREQTIMLENQNRFLENEFQRQLDKVVREKNEQISRLVHIIDRTCSPPPTEYQDLVSDGKQSSGNDELLKKFMQQNVELNREIETLRAKLEYTFTLVNEKLDQQNAVETTSSVSIIQTAFEQIREMEMRLQELKLKSTSQQEENDFLKYLMEKSQRLTDTEHTQVFSAIEKRTLEREIDRVRHELETTEKRTNQLEQKFENAEEAVQFQMEKLKLKCDVLRTHVVTCSQRLDEFNKQTSVEFKPENQIQNNKIPQQESNNDRKVIQLENELLTLRERYNEIFEHSNTLKYELSNVRKQLHEKEKHESVSNADLEEERRRANQFETEFNSLKTKYEDVCERINAATHQLERVQVVLDQTSRRCEQLEKEKSQINAQSESLSQNVANVTAKYKDKLSTIKSRLEQADRERRDAQSRCEQLQNEIERLKDELLHKKEIIFEKDKIIQDAQFKNREILHERQLVEERISNECKRLNEFVDKNRLLEEELDHMRRNHISDLRRIEINNVDSAAKDSLKHIEELRLKIDEFEQRFTEEKISRESLQIQIKLLEEENTDLRDIMTQMRKRTLDGRREERDRNDEIQQLIARAEINARQYMTNFNITYLSSPSTLARIVPLSSPTKTT